ncbi:hypothetical protein HK104_000091, partial [Borealophlyctis nickersoniae]
MATGRCVFTIEDHQDWVHSLCLGRDLLYSASRDGSIKIFDTATGQCLRTLDGHGGQAVRSVCVAGGKLYSAGDDKAVVEWDVKAGRPTRTFGGHYGAVSALFAGPDGKLFSGSSDCTVKIWDVWTRFPGSSSPVPQHKADLPPSPPHSPIPYDDDSTAPPSSIGRPDSTLSSVMSRSESMYGRPESRRDSGIGRSDSTLGRSSRVGRRESANAYPSYNGSPPSDADDARVIREQLAKAQELLSKQNRLKLRLKSELTAARTELASLKSELSAARESVERVKEVEEELGAAKELLVTYKSELHYTQEAHAVALDFLIRSADRCWLEIELELSNVQRLLDHPLTPLRGDAQDDLEKWMPRKKIERCWETDSEWDSDVEWVEDENVWWRRDTAFEARTGRLIAGSTDDDVEEESPEAEGWHWNTGIDEQSVNRGDQPDRESVRKDDMAGHDVEGVLRTSAVVTAESVVRPIATIQNAPATVFVKGYRLADGGVVASSDAGSHRTPSVRGGGRERDDYFDPITGFRSGDENRSRYAESDVDGNHSPSREYNNAAPVANHRAAPPAAAATAAKLLSSLPRARTVSSNAEPAPAQQGAKRSNSWFRPIANWVEQLGEQLAPPIPKDATPAAKKRNAPVVRVRSTEVWRFDDGSGGEEMKGHVSVDREERPSLDVEGIVREVAYVGKRTGSNSKLSPASDNGSANPLASPTFGVAPGGIGGDLMFGGVGVQDEVEIAGDWANDGAGEVLEGLAPVDPFRSEKGEDAGIRGGERPVPVKPEDGVQILKTTMSELENDRPPLVLPH